MRPAALVLTFFVLLGWGCGSAGSAVRAGSPATRPRLVVLLVYDQLGSWVLEAHEDVLSDEGAIRWIGARGFVFERARYAYAGTYTAAGHTAIATGASPSETGISSNRVWDRRRLRRVSSFDDGVHPIVGRADAFAGLAVLRAPTVADVLVDRSPHSRVVSLGMKDRSALPMGGRRPTLSAWFDAASGGFTTSSELRDELPAWLVEMGRTHPWSSYLRPWEPLRPYPELGPDEAPGEGAYGFDASFPHEPDGVADAEAFLALPWSSELLLEVARRAVQEEHLGDDDHVDFLAISIAGTDYVGHGFGPESWEARDQLVRVDEMVGRFLSWLDARTELAVLLTADHGVAPLPERAALHGLPASARRWSADEELALLRGHLEATLGPREGGWVDAWVVPWIYLAGGVRAEPEARRRAVEAARAFLATRPGIGFVFDRDEGTRLRASDDPVERAIGLGIDPEASGDIYVLPSEGSVVDDAASETGTSHGSPFDYDRLVPVLLMGPGVVRGRSREVVAQERVAATLADLLGVPAPHAGATSLRATGRP